MDKDDVKKIVKEEIEKKDEQKAYRELERYEKNLRYENEQFIKNRGW